MTVLVCGCDLFESEAYLRLDAEDQVRVLRAFQEAGQEAVRRFDGTLVQGNEQGLLVCFGYPVAYEDGARRAAHTGLALLADLKPLAGQFRREHELELHPWVGIHTGPAVVESKEDGVSLVGEARNVAVRLEDVAAPGQVLCSEATHRLLGGPFQCASLGRRKIKGVAEPVGLFEVQAVGEAHGVLERGGPAGLTPLTGRDQEISLLKDRWERAQEGMGQVVLLTGEAGLGKSRLVYTLKEHVLGQAAEGEVDAPVIEWRCSPHFQNTGLYPAIDFYERALQFGREEAPQARFERLLRRLEQYDYQKGRPPRSTCTFKHALLEDALYNALIKGKRKQFHRRIGEVHEARFPQTVETRPELLAHHFTEAGRTEKALGYWLGAGQRSRERSALCEAIGHLTRGLELLETLEESRGRDERELQFLTALGPAYITARGYAAPEVGPILLRARELCRRMDDAQQLFGIMLGMWEWRLVRAELRPCVDLAADGVALAERVDDPGMRMEALFMQGVTLFYRGRFAEARACHEKAVAAFDDRERTRFWTAYTGHDAGVTHRCYLALALWHLGYPDQALRVAREARELAGTIGHAFSLGHAVDFTAYLCASCRLGAEAQAAAEEEMAIGAEQGFQLWHALGVLHKGAGLLLQDRREEGLPILLEGYGAFRATGAAVRAPGYLGMLGEAYTQAGRFEDALEALNEGLAVAGKNDDRSYEPELHRLQGELHLAGAKDQAAAEACFRQALETARRQQSKAWELRATMSLARLRQRQGRDAEALAALAAVHDSYTEGFTTPDLVDAAGLLKALA